MIGIKPRQGSRKHDKPGRQPVSLWKQGRRALQRYLLIGTGLSSTALGLALIVSFWLAASGGSGPGRNALAAGDVEVSRIHGRYTATALDTTLAFVAPEVAPSTETFPIAPPAPPLDVSNPPANPTQVASAFPAQSETPSASPPATELDAEETPAPLDPSAAALPQPLLLQAQAQAALISPPASNQTIGQIQAVNITFYDCLEQGFCGAMYNGEPVYEGAAACSWDLPIGTRFFIEGDPTARIYVCADRGLLSDTWVDIFFYSPVDGWAWQNVIGRYATLHIVSVPSFDPPS